MISVKEAFYLLGAFVFFIAAWLSHLVYDYCILARDLLIEQGRTIVAIPYTNLAASLYRIGIVTILIGVCLLILWVELIRKKN